MAKDVSGAKTIVAKIKKLLLNYDLATEYAKAEIKLREDIMNTCSGTYKESDKRNYVNAKIERERFLVFLEEINKNRIHLIKRINDVLNRYHPRYKQIFYDVFFQEKTYYEVAQSSGYSLVAVKKIVRLLKEELIDTFEI